MHLFIFQCLPGHLEAAQHGTARVDDALAFKKSLRNVDLTIMCTGFLAAVYAERDANSARLAVGDRLEEPLKAETLRAIQNRLTV